MKRKWIIGAIFSCAECQKEWQDYRTAEQKARHHALSTGHKVTGEVTYAVEDAVEEELALREVNATFPTDGDWHIDAKLSGTAAVIIGKEIARWFKEQNAPNYVEMKMMDRDTHEVYILTVQRAEGKTPHEKRVEAEAQLAAARTQAFAEVRRVGFSADDVKFLRYEAQYARDQHGDLIAESFDFDGLANRIEALLAALASEGK